MKNVKFKYNLWLSLALCILHFAFYSCGPYKFSDASVDPDLKTVKINFFENRAQYVNPQLSPTLTDRLQQKIVNQTRLSRTNSDSAHIVVDGYVNNYAVSTSGISNQQVSINRLTVGVHITFTNRLKQKTEEYDISRSFDFPANLSLQAAGNQLLDEMVRNLTDDIFNRLFSNW